MKLKKPKFWDYNKPNIISNILFPISIIFQFISSLKVKKKRKFENIKCVCVGNIYLGGTGKTSLSIELKKIFDDENIKSCFIKKKYSDQIDEQELLKKHGKTFINKDRISAIKQAILENYEVAIFDDGLQDQGIFYDLTFVCFNQKNMIGNGRLIPSGPLRENLNCLNKNKNIFLIGNSENNQNFKDFLQNKTSDLNFYDGVYEPLNLEKFNKDENYIAFSGIGNHETFIEMLKKNKLRILKDLEFPDHHKYSIKDIEKINLTANKYNSKIITTKKDYQRINDKYRDNIQVLDIYLKIKQITQLKNKILLNK